MDLDGYLDVLGMRGTPAELRHGQFHDVVLTEALAVRFPRTERERLRLPGRAEALGALGRVGLPVAVPVPLTPVDMSLPVGRCHLVTARVPGRPGAVPDGGQLGRLLAAMAAATPAVAGVFAAPPWDWREFADAVHSELFALMTAAGRDRARAELAEAANLGPAEPVLTHRDLGGDNLLGDGGRLTGVIDWDSAGLDDPAHDIASIASSVGWAVATEAAGVAGYGDDAVERARAIWATFALQEALPALRDGDTGSLDGALADYRTP